MFDAKSLLESLVTGGRGGSQGGGLGPLGDILGQVMNQGGQSGGQASGQGAGGAPAGLEDLIRNMMGGNNPQTGNPQAPAVTERSGGAGGGDFGGFGDMMKDVLGGGSGGQAGQSSQGGGGLADILGQVLGQAKTGVQEGAGRVNDATGAGDAMGDLMRQFSGKDPQEVLSQIQDMISNNKLGTGAALGGLGALVLGTKTGRSIASQAAKLGALALIGGLAYKAYSNYASGRPLTESSQAEPEAAPQGTGFEPDSVSNDEAALLIRTMLAAAAADGRIDGDEQEKVLGSLKQAGLDDGAEEFIADAMNNPVTVDQIVAHTANKQQAVKVYTAARIAIDPDTYGERAFLRELATKLGIEPELASHIDAASSSASA